MANSMSRYSASERLYHLSPSPSSHLSPLADSPPYDVDDENPILSLDGTQRPLLEDPGNNQTPFPKRVKAILLSEVSSTSKLSRLCPLSCLDLHSRTSAPLYDPHSPSSKPLAGRIRPPRRSPDSEPSATHPPILSPSFFRREFSHSPYSPKESPSVLRALGGGEESDEEEDFFKDFDPSLGLSPEEIVRRTFLIRPLTEDITPRLERTFARAQLQSTSHRSPFSDDLPPTASPCSSQKRMTRAGEVGCAAHTGIKSLTEDIFLVEDIALPIAKITLPATLFCVLDGHGAKKTAPLSAAHYVEHHLIRILKEQMSAAFPQERPLSREEFIETGLYNALKLLGPHLHEGIRQANAEGGTTMVLALLLHETTRLPNLNKNLWVACVGDSRCILVDHRGIGTQLSEEQKPDNPYYKKDVQKRGGLVFESKHGKPRVNGVLAIPRTLGDHHLSLNPRLKITAFTLPQEPLLLALMSDGMTEGVSTQEIAQWLHEHRELPSAEDLASLMMNTRSPYSEDNATLIIVKVNH